MAVSTSGPVGFEEEDDPDVSWDFSGLRDPRAMRDFMSTCDHCLSGCSDDGHSLDDEGCDPTHECFHIDQEDHGGENHLGMPGSDGALAPASRVEIPRELAVVQVPAGGQDTQLEELREMQAKLDEEAGRLVQLRQNIEQEWAGRALAEGARHRARDVQRRIVDDASVMPPPAFNGAGQSLAAAAMLLRTMSEPSTTEGRRIQGELKGLLEDTAVRQAESSASRRQGDPSEHRATPSQRMREASVHTERTRDGTPAAPDRLGAEQHRRDCRARLEEKVRRGYHPRRGGRYDSEEDQSPSSEPPGPRVFSRAIRRAPFPARFRAPTTITNMGPIKDLKGVQRVVGCLVALSRFISRLGEKGLPLYRLLRKAERFTWTPEAKEALGNLKALLTNAPILVPPAEGEALLVYVAATTHVVSAAIVARDKKKGMHCSSRGRSTSSARCYPRPRSTTHKSISYCTQ
jgi:hypothetical protein